MSPVADGSTSPTLLRQVAHWHDHAAWVTFWRRYDPDLRRLCRGYGLGEDAVDEVSQLIWIELADRIRTFQYDPKGTFRGWLRRVCHSRAIDFLRHRQAHCLLSLEESDGEAQASLRNACVDAAETADGAGTADAFARFLLDEAEKVQEAVRAKVKPTTWDAFWLVAVCDWTVARTAQALGMTHTAVYAARERVARMLCDEGKRVLNRRAAGT